jgi:hypothetical protein
MLISQVDLRFLSHPVHKTCASPGSLTPSWRPSLPRCLATRTNALSESPPCGPSHAVNPGRLMITAVPPPSLSAYGSVSPPACGVQQACLGYSILTREEPAHCSCCCVDCLLKRLLIELEAERCSLDSLGAFPDEHYCGPEVCPAMIHSHMWARRPIYSNLHRDLNLKRQESKMSLPAHIRCSSLDRSRLASHRTFACLSAAG